MIAVATINREVKMNVQNIMRVAVACFLCASVGSYAADDSVKKAAQQLEKHYYESAAATLRAASVKGELPTPAVLAMARAYAQNAQLHRALQHSSMVVGNMYLRKLESQTGRDHSQFVPLYYGEYLAESGKQRDAAAQWQHFIGQKQVDRLYRDIAQIELSALKKTAPSEQRNSEPLLRSQLAAVQSQTPARTKDAAAQTDQALSDLLKVNPVLPVRAVTNAIVVYARSGQADKAFALLGSVDIGRPSYEETIGKSKVLRFYDATLLSNLAELYQGEAERKLQRVRADARYKSVAGYFLVELHMNAGQFAKAGALLPELLAATDLPAAYHDRLVIMQAALDVNTGKVARGNAAFVELGRQHVQDPVMLAEVLMNCVRFKAKCGSVTASARSMAKANQGERYRSLHFAVGEQYAAEGKTDRALLEMETARDKSNKNRIDANDPLLLVRLADLYFAGKSFSESLEIYFEMSKEFPGVRQLQDTGQGVYSTEYRSAGDAKIF